MSTLVWFRQDLRVTDNPALLATLEMRMLRPTGTGLMPAAPRA